MRRLYGEKYLVFIDWASAFDFVNQDMLIQVLEQSGVSERSLRIIKIVLYNSNCSIDGKNFFPIENGTP